MMKEHKENKIKENKTVESMVQENKSLEDQEEKDTISSSGLYFSFIYEDIFDRHVKHSGTEYTFPIEDCTLPSEGTKVSPKHNDYFRYHTKLKGLDFWTDRYILIKVKKDLPEESKEELKNWYNDSHGYADLRLDEDNHTSVFDFLRDVHITKKDEDNKLVEQFRLVDCFIISIEEGTHQDDKDCIYIELYTRYMYKEETGKLSRPFLDYFN